MKRIKKEDLPEILIPDDNRKTVDIGKLLKDYANLLEKQFKENWYKERHKELAEHLLLRKGFARWIEKQRERAESNSDLRRIELFWCARK